MSQCHNFVNGDILRHLAGSCVPGQAAAGSCPENSGSPRRHGGHGENQQELIVSGANPRAIRECFCKCSSRIVFSVLAVSQW